MNVKVYTAARLLFTTVQTLFKHMESQTVSVFVLHCQTSAGRAQTSCFWSHLFLRRLVMFMNSGLISEAYQCFCCINSVIQGGVVQLMVA